MDGVYNEMTKVPMAIDINPRSGGTTGVRPLPQFGRILQTQSIGYVDYKALLVRLEKRFDNSYMYMVSYTLDGHERQRQQLGGTQSTVTDSAHIDYDLGPNNSDRRHALVASGAVLLPFDVNLSGVFTARSTMPFSALAGVDLNGDANNTDYVPGTTRNVFNRGNDAERDGAGQRVARAARRMRSTQGPGAARRVADRHERVLQPRHARDQVVRARQPSTGRGDRPGVQPAEQDEPAARLEDQRAVDRVRDDHARPSNMRQAEVAVRFAW